MEILQIYAHAYAECVNFLQSAANTVLQQANFWDDPMFSPFLEQWLVRLEEICDKDELPVTRVLVTQVKELLEVAHEKENPLSQLAPQILDKDLLFTYLERIRLTFIDELSTKFFFQLQSQRKQQFERPTTGWEEIIERFPETITDIEEMGKSFALSRYTAAVFHSLIVVERGLINLGHAIGVKDPKPGWDATCTRMKSLLDTGHKGYPALPVTFASLEQINSCAQSMKLAWRNKINHAAGQLTVLQSGFVPDVAEEIIVATRGFMRRLAIDLPKVSV